MHTCSSPTKKVMTTGGLPETQLPTLPLFPRARCCTQITKNSWAYRGGCGLSSACWLSERDISPTILGGWGSSGSSIRISRSSASWSVDLLSCVVRPLQESVLVGLMCSGVVFDVRADRWRETHECVQEFPTPSSRQNQCRIVLFPYYNIFLSLLMSWSVACLYMRKLVCMHTIKTWRSIPYLCDICVSLLDNIAGR